MSNKCLITIDIQEGFHDPYWGDRNNPDFEERVLDAVRFWRERKWPIIHVQHLSTNPASPLHPSQRGVDFMEMARPLPGERIIQKRVNSAFIGTPLEGLLNESGFRSLTFIGLTTDHCVSTSVRMAANLGFSVTIISDATAAFSRVGHEGICHSAEVVHRISLASLRGEFARITNFSQVMKES